MAKGQYIQNVTGNVIAYSSMDNKLHFVLRPRGENGDLQYIPGEQHEDPRLVKLIKRELVVFVTDGDDKEAAQVEERKAASAAAIKESLTSLDTSYKDALVERQCSAVTAAGNQCKKMVVVKFGAAEENTEPLFCGTHKDTVADDFVKTEDGTWVPKVAE